MLKSALIVTVATLAFLTAPANAERRRRSTATETTATTTTTTTTRTAEPATTAGRGTPANATIAGAPKLIGGGPSLVDRSMNPAISLNWLPTLGYGMGA